MKTIFDQRQNEHIFSVLLFIIALISGAPTNRPIIDTIEKGYDVTDSGLKKGDLIVGLNGDKIVNADDFMLKLQVSAGEEITLKVKRGDIFLADLSAYQGSEQKGVRPVLIIQNNKGNK